MAFNWYTTDQFNDAKVWVSESGQFDDAQSFDATSKKWILNMLNEIRTAISSLRM